MIRARHGYRPAGKKSPTYCTWQNMKDRCLNPNSTAWPYYGSRGIKVCDEWMDFANFLRDMGERPEDKTIDRIDTNGNYCKENCRWATRSEQRANQGQGKRKDAVEVELNGEKMNAYKAAEILGISHDAVRWRWKKWGRLVKQAS